jgi:hypothetical protein
VPLYKIFKLVFLSLIILFQDVRAWKMKKIVRDLSQVKKGISLFSHMPMGLPEGVRKEME